MKMKQMLKTRLLPVTAGAVAVALAAGGVAYASAPASTKPAAPAASSKVTPARRHPVLRADLIRLARHTVHAQLIVDTKKGFETIDIDKGKLVSDSSGTITIMRLDGPSVSATVTSSTRFFGIQPAKLVAGDRVLLVSGSGGHALDVASRGPAKTSSSSNS